MGAGRSLYSIRLLRIALSIFFIIIGLYGILSNVDESFFSLNASRNMEMLFGIIELICGLLLLLGFFAFKSRGAVYWGGFIVFIFWIVRIILTKVIWSFGFSQSGIRFYHAGNFEIWILALATELVIAAGLLAVVNRYD